MSNGKSGDFIAAEKKFFKKIAFRKKFQLNLRDQSIFTTLKTSTSSPV